jgi:uncharacterized 2Fe-2S/4Fe-4S cluster protein (DUF4445 family)|tara:strand:- start:96 stop:296 length:201 start_codon:yes stop_codon:yes gene_type:complete
MSLFDTWDQALYTRDRLREISTLANKLSELSLNIVDDFDNNIRCAAAETNLQEVLNMLKNKIEELN